MVDGRCVWIVQYLTHLPRYMESASGQSLCRKRCLTCSSSLPGAGAQAQHLDPVHGGLSPGNASKGLANRNVEAGVNENPIIILGREGCWHRVVPCAQAGKPVEVSSDQRQC